MQSLSVFTYYDLIVICLLLVMAIKGFKKGVVYSLFTSAGWIASWGLSRQFGWPTAKLISEELNCNCPRWIGVTLLLMAGIAMSRVLTRAVLAALNQTEFGKFDRLCGMAIGIGKASLIVGICSTAFHFLHADALVDKSLTWRLLVKGEKFCSENMEELASFVSKKPTDCSVGDFKKIN